MCTNNLMAHLLMAYVIAVRIVTVGSCSNNYTSLNATNFVKAVKAIDSWDDHLALVQAEATAYSHTSVRGRLAFLDSLSLHNIGVALMKNQSIVNAWVGLRCFGGGGCSSIGQFTWTEDGAIPYMDVDWVPGFSSDDGYDCLKIETYGDGSSVWDDRRCSDVWTGAIYELIVEEDPCASNPCIPTENCVPSCLLVSSTYSCVTPPCAEGKTGTRCDMTLIDWEKCQMDSSYYLASTDSCYHVANTTGNFYANIGTCTAFGGGYPVAIHSDEENQFVHNVAKKFSGHTTQVMLGMYRLQGAWVWDSRIKANLFTYHKFDPDYSNLALCLALNEEKYWVERDCSETKYTLCKDNPASPGTCNAGWILEGFAQQCLDVTASQSAWTNPMCQEVKPRAYLLSENQCQGATQYVASALSLSTFEIWIGQKRTTPTKDGGGVYHMDFESKWAQTLHAFNSSCWKCLSMCMVVDDGPKTGMWTPCDSHEALTPVCEKAEAIAPLVLQIVNQALEGNV